MGSVVAMTFAIDHLDFFGLRQVGHHLRGLGQLRDGIGLGEVRDVLWNYLAIDTYERLVLTQGWPLERYSRWLTHAITGALCP